jgi:hypothetical protein
MSNLELVELALPNWHVIEEFFFKVFEEDGYKL